MLYPYFIVWLSGFLTFNIGGFIFFFIDKYDLLSSYKIANKNEYNISYIDILKRSNINLLVGLLPMMWWVNYMGWVNFDGNSDFSHSLISMLCMTEGHDIVQYIIHRWILHNKHLYKVIGHNIHHTIIADISISSLYNSLGDFILLNGIPYILPLIMIGCNNSVIVNCLILSLGMLGGLYEHSGYDLSRLNIYGCSILENRYHYKHHIYLKYNYSNGFGSPGVIDYIFGTYTT